jgi:hypothetical protein
MKFKPKRDETSTSAPASNQLEVGELVMNSVTGKLYTKLVSGAIVEFVGQQVCYIAVPDIEFDNVSDFCCYGDVLTVKIRGLQPSPTTYSFEIQELTNNDSTTTVRTPVYSNYTGSSVAGSNPVALREAIIPIDVEINGNNPISIFKFTVLSGNIPLTEKTISICCKNCGTT